MEGEGTDLIHSRDVLYARLADTGAVKALGSVFLYKPDKSDVAARYSNVKVRDWLAVRIPRLDALKPREAGEPLPEAAHWLRLVGFDLEWLTDMGLDEEPGRLEAKYSAASAMVDVNNDSNTDTYGPIRCKED